MAKGDSLNRKETIIDAWNFRKERRTQELVKTRNEKQKSKINPHEAEEGK